MRPVTMLEIILRKHAANYYVGGYLEKTWPVTILGIILRKHAANYYVGNYLEKVTLSIERKTTVPVILTT